VDITFGEYLRAVLTADVDVVPHDEYAYREAWIDAFARRRIYPRDVPRVLFRLRRLTRRRPAK
jgi:hypothetical protein